MNWPRLAQSNFNRILAQAIALPLFLMVLLASLLVWQINDLVQAMRWVSHTDEVIAHAQYTEKLLLDTQTQLRGYIITGNPTFLQSHIKASASVNPAFDRLSNIVSDNPPQVQRVERVRTNFARWRQHTRQEIAFRQNNSNRDTVDKLGKPNPPAPFPRREGGEQPLSTPLVLPYEGRGQRTKPFVRGRGWGGVSTQTIATNVEQGRIIMRSMRDELAAFVRTEENLQKRRSQVSEKSLWFTLTIGTGSACLLGFVIAFNSRHLLIKLSRTYKNALELTQMQSQALQESEQRLRRAIMDAPFPAMIHAEDGEILLLSKTWTELSGYSLQEIPTVTDWIEKAYGQNKESVKEEIDKVYNLKDRLQEGEYIITTSNGEKRIWDFSTAPLGKLPDGRHLAISMAADVSDRKQAEAEIRQLNDNLEQRVEERTAKLEEINRELEAFSYTISHDLRAPLRAMQGFSQALLEDCGEQLDSLGEEYIQHIVSAAQYMDTLIQDLLSYSRLSRTDLQLREVDLTLAVEDAIAQLKDEITKQQAQVTVKSPLPEVIAHRTTLTQVIINLLNNALKFVRPDRSPEIEIWAEERTLQNSECPIFVRLWVEDNGIGIEEKHHQRIFQVFERLHGIETYPGTGIGLAIVRKGIERMGGQVGVESRPGQGSRFWIELLKA